MKKIRSKIKKLTVSLGLAVLFLSPVLAFAGTVNLQPPNPGLPSLGLTVEDAIIRIVQIILAFVAALAILFIVIGGFQYITSGGNEEMAKKGKQTLINAIIGLIVVILSYAIIYAIVTTFVQPIP